MPATQPSNISLRKSLNNKGLRGGPQKPLTINDLQKQFASKSHANIKDCE